MKNTLDSLPIFSISFKISSFKSLFWHNSSNLPEILFCSAHFNTRSCFGTTIATVYVLSPKPVTKICAINWLLANIFSIFSGAIYSPYFILLFSNSRKIPVQV